MLNLGKWSILGVNVDAVDYDFAVARIVEAAVHRQALSVGALAVHGVMTGALDPVHRRRLNGLDLVVPDGQPVRWALRWLHGQCLADRVYGPELMYRVLCEAERARLGVFFYGTTPATLASLVPRLRKELPGLFVAGAEASRFRRLSGAEREALQGRIRSSGARIVFVGLGCPRQETWAYEYRPCLDMPILAVGAAFDFHAGTLSQAPRWMQDRGFEWVYRLMQEPGRLWRRYLLLNPAYLFRVGLQKLGLHTPEALSPTGHEPIESYG